MTHKRDCHLDFFRETEYSSAYDEKFVMQVILIITIQYTCIGKTLPGLCLIKS